MTCRFLLPWRKRPGLGKLSRGHLRPWPGLLLCVPVQAVRWRPLLLLQKRHICHRPVSGRILLLVGEHVSTTFLNEWRSATTTTVSQHRHMLYIDLLLVIVQQTISNLPPDCFIFKLTNDSCFSFCLPPGRGGPCPAGHYCPPASVSPLPCPRATYSNLTKLVSQVTFTLTLRSLAPRWLWFRDTHTGSWLIFHIQV